ncbi:helix-turn-helix transcriptional regulator [Streptomyces lunaelactis]|uniref:ArsR/SmtB family transcription factor n=1 Tax=Streptomyces lunaelactis TaxID=1535768 RepID=UPI0015855E7E|nr:helix-turn-helix domain-containing protein [Streptomyces lunaelactis]NUK05335.1 helix-turn-helix transcriptional regulator [Streptomyces lunaelactis]NUK12086.1 helix-turn-helix transcriptional regulator [Streptomyces lunaelactis]NUK19695.1 helix-turn-helix transcriptional regulator [Streptomyces lunaelactis]NUK38803.1 helix-turn-helix transcriptional regulator [Streptomyces lunaelactis]NUK45868.1 helix-turn-helix transcriptional regulator [Streptomyces lunaelactis]
MPEPEPSPGSERHTYRPLDPRSLRGLAHPLRMRLLTTLRHDGPATASQLADKLGESSGATSYHLRQLAAHGFVEDDPERGKGRERWWKSSVDGTGFSDSLFSDPDPAVRGAADLFIHEVATMHTQEVGTWLGTAREWPEKWRRTSDLSDWTLRLTPAQAGELNEKIHELIESYRDLAPDTRTEDTAQIRMHLHAFPRSTD